MDNINAIKASIVTVFATISACLGWFGWLVVIFVGSLLSDWITGTLVACKNGQWSSKASREGIWHKFGSIIAVLVAAVVDIVIGMVINNIPSVTLPFTYTVLLCPIVLVWYIVGELGSIIENAGLMGAPVPSFLQKMIVAFKNTVDDAGNKIVDNK
ncbi:phage holin family protein [Ruminiclostridium cellulolyticum]|uniref:Toxin secretion/phage lysis holin n=1 Tax=Ruminiclostridium cellulolyticum (strain ATCC 35319 / DSM 5812 / JCM 6584 / H10) TaxID=394503 RepID=B8I8D7_RUMCH|nr:phage holin family protein [Ruminiclostridium cellulolyticum]ACL77237.1 toxin secretion/phage lysis holin [Ruminiclostridium cellulolyticum H10]